MSRQARNILAAHGLQSGIDRHFEASAEGGSGLREQMSDLRRKISRPERAGGLYNPTDRAETDEANLRPGPYADEQLRDFRLHGIQAIRSNVRCAHRLRNVDEQDDGSNLRWG
jgi:hypothetical protein